MAMNRGICFDLSLYNDFMQRWHLKEKGAEAELAMAVPGVDFHKPSQVRNWLGSRLAALQLAGHPRTPTGELSVKKDDLLDLLVDIPELDAYGRMNAAANKRSRHAGLKSALNPTTRRIHPEFRICGAVTGRMSCRNPNTQSQEKTEDWRACFRADEGKVLVRGDYSQVELRIASILANETRMLEVFADPGGDIHSNTIASIMSISPLQVSREQRGLAKALNFGLLYGMGAAAFRKYAAKPPVSVQLSLRQAADLRARFFGAYPRLREWQRCQAARAERHSNWVATTVLGREVRCIKDTEAGRQFHYTRSLNVPIQGSAADLLHVALGKLPSVLVGLDACPLLFVHDEIVLEAAVDDAEEAERRLEAIMTDAFVDLFSGGAEMVGLVNVDVSTTWGQ